MIASAHQEAPPDGRKLGRVVTGSAAWFCSGGLNYAPHRLQGAERTRRLRLEPEVLEPDPGLEQGAQGFRHEREERVPREEGPDAANRAQCCSYARR